MQALFPFTSAVASAASSEHSIQQPAAETEITHPASKGEMGHAPLHALLSNCGPMPDLTLEMAPEMQQRGVGNAVFEVVDWLCLDHSTLSAIAESLAAWSHKDFARFVTVYLLLKGACEDNDWQQATEHVMTFFPKAF